MKHAPPPARESGQAAVEAALIVPMMLFLVLGVLQLTMMQHARLMTEYAAYRAVRSGIVNSGSCEYMKDSALIALLPTLGPVGPIPGRTDTLGRALLLRKTFTTLGLNSKKYLPSGLQVVKVNVLNPPKGQLGSLFNTYGVRSASSGRRTNLEIDFDDVRDTRVIEANLLSVRVTYFYEMRIPFANQLIHSWYMGLEYLDHLRGVQFENQRAFGAVNSFDYLEGRGGARGGDYARMAMLAKLRKVFVVPLVATYSMRMQSNLLKNHVQDCAL